MAITFRDQEDGVSSGGVHGSLTVGTTAVEAKVGASALSSRIYLIIQAKDNGVFMGTSNTVTTSTGVELFKNQILVLPINNSIWFIATGAGKNVRLIELDSDQTL